MFLGTVTPQPDAAGAIKQLGTLRGNPREKHLVFRNGRPEAVGQKPGLLEFGITGKINQWLLNNKEVLCSCEDYRLLDTLNSRLSFLLEHPDIARDAVCKETLQYLLKTIRETHQKVTPPHLLGQLGLQAPKQHPPLFAARPEQTADCINGKVTFPAQMTKVLARPPASVWFNYDKQVVQDFIHCLRMEGAIIWRTPKELKQLASLAEEMGVKTLADAIWVRLMAKIPMDEVLRLLIDFTISLEASRVYYALERCRADFADLLKMPKTMLQKLPAAYLEEMCRHQAINASDAQIWRLICLWKEGKPFDQIAELRFERWFHLEWQDDQWFNDAFILTEDNRALLSQERSRLWSTYLMAKAENHDAQLPIDQLREKRTRFVLSTQPDDIPILGASVSALWYETRDRRPEDCRSIRSRDPWTHRIDAPLTDRALCNNPLFERSSPEAVEDFVRILYGLPPRSHLFETLNLFHECGYEDKCNAWIQDALAQRTIPWTDWMRGVHHQRALPKEVEQAALTQLVARATQYPGDVQTIPAARLIHLISHRTIENATSEQLLTVVQNYAGALATEHDRSTFMKELCAGMTTAGSMSFATLLKDRGFMTEGQLFFLVALRRKEMALTQNAQLTVHWSISEGMAKDFVLLKRKDMPNRFRLNLAVSASDDQPQLTIRSITGVRVKLRISVINQPGYHDFTIAPGETLDLSGFASPYIRVNGWEKGNAVLDDMTFRFQLVQEK